MSNLFERESQLTGADVELIKKAILDAYTNRQFLYVRLATKWGVNADDVVYTHQPGIIVVSELADWAKIEGRLLDLLALVWTDSREHNPQLLALVERFFDDLQTVREKYALPPLDPLQPPALAANAIAKKSLEKIVTERSRFTDVTAFIDRLQLISGAICRITALGSMGTGFLIGRKTVLTNYHVVEAAMKQAIPGDQITCEFDFHGPEGARRTCIGANGITWKLLDSPYSESDLSGVGEPVAGSLDFAVIRLAEPVEPTRRSISLPTSVPIVSPLDPVAILQHPGGEQQQIAWGSVLEYPASGLRYRYDATTIGGSSGSPVMSADLNLIALHHAADPAANPAYNQGVPIWRIVRALTDADLLGEDL